MLKNVKTVIKKLILTTTVQEEMVESQDKDSLDYLWNKARDYGRVRLFTMDDGDYHCSIEFNTIEHVQLQAKSDFDSKTPQEAVKKAIIKAEEIVNSISKYAESRKFIK